MKPKDEGLPEAAREEVPADPSRAVASGDRERVGRGRRLSMIVTPHPGHRGRFLGDNRHEAEQLEYKARNGR